MWAIVDAIGDLQASRRTGDARLSGGKFHRLGRRFEFVPAEWTDDGGFFNGQMLVKLIEV